MAIADIERILKKVGAENHGVATRRQLLRGGLGVPAIDRLVRVGRVTVLRRGLYQIGPVPTARATQAAAVLVGGATSRISHRTTAVILDLMEPPTAHSPTEVTVPRNRRPQLAHLGIRVHRGRDLRPDETTTIAGIPVTTPARTLLDLGECTPIRDLEQALANALRRELVTREEVRAMVARHPKHRGAARLRRVLDAEGGPAFTRSEAEERLLRLTRDAGLPPPEVNVRVLGYEVDFLWRTQRVVVEVDGYAYHSSPQSFVADRRRDAELASAGYRVIRFTWSDVTERALASMVRLAQLLGR